MLESAEYGTIAELAAVERINPSYLARVCRLTLLAPATVESLLLSRQKALTLGDLMKPFPVVWSDQGF